MAKFLSNRPALLEKTYQAAERAAWALNPLIARIGYKRVERLIKPAEDFAKELIFGCHHCGQCILHSTGMSCPMECPKNLRNGPCGGVRASGHCEVKPEMRCVWVVAFENSQQMPIYGHELVEIQPPVDRQLEHTSAWVNMLTGVDKQTPAGWVPIESIGVAQNA
ncbi:MAG: methylenetetrahydrofolate reductase C-terminal domain-containing protein [Caldilinea sp.]